MSNYNPPIARSVTQRRELGMAVKRRLNSYLDYTGKKWEDDPDMAERAQAHRVRRLTAAIAILQGLLYLETGGTHGTPPPADLSELT